MSDFMGIVEMIDAQLLRRHNNTATEFFEAGQQAERERIIKLLKDDLCGGGKPALSDDEHCEHDEQTLHLITLIEGER